MPNRTATPTTAKDWSDFLRRLGNALSLVLEPEEDEPAGYLLHDPFGAEWIVLRELDGALAVRGPSYSLADDVPRFMVNLSLIDA